MDRTLIKEEPADDTTRGLNDVAHEYCQVLNKFETIAARCPFQIAGECLRLSGKWRCGIINCPYCAPIFMIYMEETKKND